MKKYLKHIRILAFFLLMAAVLAPSTVWAAEGNIFTIISNKMITTLQDVRKIVYVIAGFGLIMFAVLAIFNKISFKHLAYIMIGLSLLAVMMPFINYFSGANLQDDEYSYGNFISGGDASIVGSDVSNTEICQGQDCPGRIESIDSDDLIMGEINTGQGNNLPGISTDWDSNGCRWNNGERECCDGKIKKGVCKGTMSFQDILQTGKDIINAGKGAINAVEYGMSTVDAVKEGIQDINDIISGDGTLWDKMGDLASSIGSSIDEISSDTNAALGSLGGSLGNVGSAGDRIAGDNSVSDSLSGTQDFIDGAQDTVGDISGGIQDGVDTTKDIYGMGNDVRGMGNRVGNWFDGN